ncbi:MAG: hypothetical protein QM757_20025 [Paludibaculum sp.]
MRALLLLSGASILLAPVARAQEVTVFAAASLTDAMRDISGLWEKAGHLRSASPSPPAPPWRGRSSRVRRPTCSPRPTSAGWIISPSGS